MNLPPAFAQLVWSKTMSEEVKTGPISLEVLREYLRYEPETGVMYWKKKAARRTKVGDRAGSVSRTTGYASLRIAGALSSAHRAAWLLTYGEPADGDIDHINGDKADNRIENLRVVTRAVNSQNRRRPNRNGTSGYLGVSWNKRESRFQAKLGVEGKRVHVGNFPTAELAHAAYVAAKRRLHPGCTL